MYYLKTESSFDSAHFLKGYAGKCRNLHGHRWRVVVEIAADQLKDEGQTRGMLVDFSDLNPQTEPAFPTVLYRSLLFSDSTNRQRSSLP